ncbi:MAG: hypothetical protein HZA48_12320 [Planctomycetes bacterium]|nr:hypothetical protein [Planctomycetota bacterium]
MNSLKSNSDIRLYYKLDPGEPGMLKSARAETSTLQVTGQETRNLQRLRHNAFVDGKVVISSGITYARGVEGTMPVVRAGHTRVVSADDTKPMSVIPDILSQPPVQDSPVKLPGTQDAPADAADAPDSYNAVDDEEKNASGLGIGGFAQDTPQEIDREKQQLKIQYDRLEQQEKQSQFNPAGDAGRAELDNQLEDLRKEINKLDFKKLTEANNRINGFLTETGALKAGNLSGHTDISV